MRIADDLDDAALAAGNPAPGWEQRLRVLRDRLIVLLAGDAEAGRSLIAGTAGS